MQNEIASLLWTPNYGTALAIALFLSGTLYAIPSATLAFTLRTKPATGLTWQRRLAILAIAVFTCTAALFIILEGAEADNHAKNLIALAATPHDQRMIQVMNDGTIVISERSSAVTERGQLVNFERNHVTVPANLFPEVWRLAGGNAIQPGPTNPAQ